MREHAHVVLLAVPVFSIMPKLLLCYEPYNDEFDDGSFVTDSLAQFFSWWEYQGSYYESKRKDYVYYDKNLD